MSPKSISHDWDLGSELLLAANLLSGTTLLFLANDTGGKEAVNEAPISKEHAQLKSYTTEALWPGITALSSEEDRAFDLMKSFFYFWSVTEVVGHFICVSSLLPFVLSI